MFYNAGTLICLCIHNVARDLQNFANAEVLQWNIIADSLENLLNYETNYEAEKFSKQNHWKCEFLQCYTMLIPEDFINILSIKKVK